MKLGFLPQPSDPERMAALIGPARTRMILMAGQKITRQERRMPLVWSTGLWPDMLMTTAQELVADSLSADPEIAAGISRLCP